LQWKNIHEKFFRWITKISTIIIYCMIENFKLRTGPINLSCDTYYVGKCKISRHLSLHASPIQCVPVKHRIVPLFGSIVR
jgi:hypothetical protein